MSKYTTEVRYVCEFFAGNTESVGYLSIDEVLEKSYNKIFDFKFPIFDENYRKPLCIKILKHYYTREICEETVGLWKLRLNTRMNEIMPYYNKLYEAWAEDFNPLYDTDLTRKHKLDRTGRTDGKQTTDTTSEGTTKDLYSDTPQGSLNNIDSETYLTNARKIVDNEKVNGTNVYGQDIKSTDEYIETITGKSGGISYSKMLNEYKESLLNIDLMVINELENLFLMIW